MSDKAPLFELPRPGAVTHASVRADEVLSVWLVDHKELAAVFPPTLYGADVWKWGHMLAAVARYVAHANTGAGAGDRTAALAAIKAGFENALQETAPEGALQGQIKEG